MKPENRHLLKKGIELTYTTNEVAKIFGHTRQWVLLGLTEKRWLDANEEPFTPRKSGRGGYIWTAAEIENIAISLYNRRTIGMTELRRVVRKLIQDTGEINERY